MSSANKVDEIINNIESLNILELNELTKKMEEKYGIVQMPMGVGMPSQVKVEEKSVEEEKTEFDVILEQVGDKKINVIKVVRELTGLGLKEAKDLVEGAPKPIKEKISKEEAENIKAKLTEQGATVTIK